MPRARPGFRVSDIRTQADLNRAQTVRERLVATLALFFAGGAPLLAGIGMYGMLDYSVLQRRREIGIRRAIGAQSGAVAWLVTRDVFFMGGAGAIVGVALGLGSVQYIETLLYQIKPSDPAALALPMFTIVVAALLAAIPPIVHAVRIDPAMMLRAE